MTTDVVFTMGVWFNVRVEKLASTDRTAVK